MKNTNILIVEDESIVAMELESYIQRQGYTVAGICSNAKDAFAIVIQEEINIIMMDICIKGDIDGIETAEIIKKSHPDIEIISLTAHLDDYNVDRAIELNPIAYLAKPFGREELRVFLKIALRKISKEIDINEIHQKHMTLDHEFSYDLPNYTLYCCNEMISLTKKESALLSLFIEHKNLLLDFYTIENHIWPDKETSANSIRTLVKRLRQKLKHKFIKSVSSLGYTFTIDKKRTEADD